MIDLEPIDLESPLAGECHDELPLWSAPFGLWLLDRVPLAPDLTVLDVGAGTGFLSIELAERCGPRSTVIAVDPWAAAAGRLRRKLQHRGLKRVQVLEQDAATLALPPDSVDVIVSNLGINNFEDPATVLRLCARVARPGAMLLLTTNLVGHMSEFYEVFRQVLRDTGQHDRLGVLEAHVAHRATPASLRSQLQGAGFEVQEIATDRFRMRYADGTALLRHHFIRLGFLPAWKALVEPARAPETFERLEEALNAHAARHGELALTVPTAGVVACKPAGRVAP